MPISLFYNPTDDSHRVMSSTMYRLCKRYGNQIKNIIRVKDLRNDICVSTVSDEYQIIPLAFTQIKNLTKVRRLMVYQTSHNVGKWCGATSHINGVVCCESNTLYDMLCDVIDQMYPDTIVYQFYNLTTSFTIIKLYHYINASVTIYDTPFIKHFSTNDDLRQYIQRKIDEVDRVVGSLYRQLGIHQEHINKLNNIIDSFGEGINNAK